MKAQTKIGIFVEGQAEQIFLRELFRKIIAPLVDYDIAFDCIKFHAKKDERVPYRFGDTLNAAFVFYIYNVEGDYQVVKQVSKRAAAMLQGGKLNFVIGLQDIYNPQHYPAQYKEPNAEVNQKFKEEKRNTILKTIKNNPALKDKIYLCFAVMELEAWFLGMWQIFKKIDHRLSKSALQQLLPGLPDPETTYLHPTVQMNTIFESIHRAYNKHEKQIETICNKIELTDIIQLYHSGYCASFKEFCNTLIQATGINFTRNTSESKPLP